MDAGTIAILLQAKDELSPVLNSAAGAADGFGSKMGLVSAAAGVALVGLGVAAFKGLASVGEAFDGAYDTIRVGTGATGEVLAGLQDDFKAVVSDVPTDFETASQAVADLNTRLGLTGEPLQEMSKQFINLGRIAGEDTPTLIAEGTRAFGDWAIATEDQSGALDHMFRVSQSTGIGVSELMGKVVQFGAPLRAMGFSFEESTAMMGKWEKEGVNTELVLGSMRIAMGKFADAGIPMREGLDQTIAAIQELGPGAEATSLAMDVFGARAGPDMAAAILEGRFAIDDLMTTLSGSGDTINGVAAATDDWREKLQILKNKGMVALEPVANFVFGQINAAVDLLILTIGVLTGTLGGPLRAAFGFLQGAVAGVLDGWKQLSSEDNAGWFEAIGFRARQVADFLSGTVVPAFRSFAATVASGARVVASTLRTVGEAVMGGVAAAFRFLQPILAPYVQLFRDIRTNARDVLTVLNPMVAIVIGLAQAFGKGGLSGAIAALPGILVGVIGSFRVVGSMLLTFATSLFTAVWDAVTGVDWASIARSGVDALVAGFRAVTNLGSRILSWATDQITGTDWVGIASDVGSDIVDGVLTAVRTVADFGSRFASWVAEQIGSVDWAGQASAVGTAITDGAMTAIQAVTDWGGRFATWATGQLSGIDWSGVGTAIINGITTGLTSAQGFGQSLVDVLSPSLTNADWAGPASGIVSGISGAMAAIDWSGLVTGLTTGVTSAVTALAPLWESITTAASTILPALVSLWDTLSASFTGSSEIMTSLSTLWATLVTSAQQLWTALVPLQPVLVAIGAVIGGIIVVAIGLLMGVLGGLVGLLSGVLPGAIQMVSGMITSLAGVIQVATAIIVGVLGIVTALLRGDWSAAWQAAKTMVQGVADGIRTIISGMVTAITGLISGLVGGVVGMISGFVNAVIGFFTNLYHELVGGSIIPDLVNGIIDWISRLPGEVLGLVSSFVTGALGFLSGLAADGLAAITGMVTDMLASLGSLATDGAAKAGELATGVLTSITGMVTDGIAAILNLATNGLASFGSLVTGGLTKAGELATGVVTGVTTMATDAVTAIVGFATEGLSSLAGFVTDAVAKVGELPGLAAGALGDLGGTLLSAGSDLIQGFIDGITSKIPDVQGALGDLTGKIVGWKGPPEKDAVLLVGNGRLIMDGLIQGFRDRLPSVEATLGGVAAIITAGVIAGGSLQAAQASGAQMADAVIAGYANEAPGINDAIAAMGLDAVAAMQAEADNLSVSLQLARIAGEDTAELQEELDSITAILAGWAAANGTTIVDALGADSAGAAIHDSWMNLLGDLEGIISGDVQGALNQQLYALQEQLALAIGGDAPQSVLDAIAANIASVEAQLSQVGAVFQQAVQQGMVDAYSPEMIANFGSDLDAIINGTLVPDLQASLDAANARVAMATALNWNQELIDAYQAEADALAEDLAQAHSDTAAAAAAGLLSEDALAAYNDAMGVVTEIPLDQIRALIPKMADGGTELVDSLVGAIADGRLAAEDAWSMLSDMSGEQIDTMRDQLETLEEQLTVQLAQAFLDGTDPSGIAANLAAIEALLAQTADVANDTAEDVNSALTSLNAPSSSGGGGGGGSGPSGGYGGRNSDPSGMAGGGNAPGNDNDPASTGGSGSGITLSDESIERLAAALRAAMSDSLTGAI